MVLSFAAGNSGGITRDLLIGAVPPGAVGDWRYLGVSLIAGLVTFYFSSLIVRMSNAVLVFDAAGLALFAVTGSSKALSFGLNPVMATVLGMVTGIGGGMVRDVLLAEIPTVLRADLYAVAALAAAAIVVIGHVLQLPVAPGHGGGADFVLPASRHGDQTGLAASGRERGRTRGPRNPEGRLEDRRAALDGVRCGTHGPPELGMTKMAGGVEGGSMTMLTVKIG